MEKLYLSLTEAAEVLGIDRKTMSKIVHSQDFKYTRLGRKILINKQQMMEFLDEHQIIRY